MLAETQRVEFMELFVESEITSGILWETVQGL